MILSRRIAAVLLTATLTLSSQACAQSAAGDEVIRTVREAPAAPTTTLAEDFDAVSAAVDAAAEAWTSGDVEAVMATYDPVQPLLVFIGDTPLKGPDAVRAHLATMAAAPGGLGAMRYEWFETLRLDENTAVVSGRVVLDRGGATRRGLFTRLMRRTTDGWRILHDQLAWGA